MKVDTPKVRTLLILSLFFTCSMFSACKSDREKCEEGDLDACERVIKETAKEAKEALDDLADKYRSGKSFERTLDMVK